MAVFVKVNLCVKSAQECLVKLVVKIRCCNYVCATVKPIELFKKRTCRSSHFTNIVLPNPIESERIDFVK